MKPDLVRYSGVVSYILDGGRGAIVKLDNSVLGKKHAIIAGATRGRIALMNGKGIIKGTRVKGEAEDSVEALLAISVSASNESYKQYA